MEPILEGRRRLAADPQMEAVGDIVSRLRLDEARALRRLGRLEQALARFDEALAGAISSNSQLRIFWCSIGRAQVLTDQGRLDEGQAALAQARALREQLDLQAWGQLLALAQAEAALALARGDNTQAAALWQRVAADERQRTHRRDAALLPFEAEVALQTQGAKRAAELARQALSAVPPGPSQPSVAYDRSRLQMVLARALSALGMADEALATLRELLARNRESSDPAYSPERLIALREMARLLLQRDENAEARAALLEAQTIDSRHSQLGPPFRSTSTI